MNNIAGGCSNRVSNLLRAELGSVSLRYKARHHFNTELSISDVAGDKLHRHISLTSCPQGGEESTAYSTPCHAMFLLCLSNGETVQFAHNGYSGFFFLK